eukprot:8083739-Lingulodinium_polyedra.AAC.1
MGYPNVASPGTPALILKMWLIDTGCGHDLVTKGDAQKMKRFIKRASQPMSFNTANGITHVDEVLKVDVDEFASTVKPYILDNTPNVLS